MISITKMVRGKATVSEVLTYKGDRSYIPRELVKRAREIRPIVVWNLTGKCNLKCLHCYASIERYEDELDTNEIKRVIDDLSDVGVPLIILSGGEPILRKDLFEIAEYASMRNIKVALSTNGTLINEDVAEKIRDSGFSYVGVSIDGSEHTHDRFRGVKGSFRRAVSGLINAKEAGVMTGIRFTVTRFNLNDVSYVLDLAVENEIPRFCLYHLVPSGRAEFGYDINPEERRRVVDFLFERSLEDDECEILTVDNPCDGIYICLKLREFNEKLAQRAFEFLKFRGGDKSGFQLANIDMFGYVHPNQFWWDYTCGNVRYESFGDIWLKPRDELLIKLRNKGRYLRGRCGRCAYRDVCGGFRLRALRYGDLWGFDPSCYLRDDEISKNVFI